MVHLRLTEWEHREFAIAAKRLRDSRADLLRRAVREIVNQPADLLQHELEGFDEAVRAPVAGTSRRIRRANRSRRG